MNLPDAIEDALLEFSLFESIDYPQAERTTEFALSLTRGLLHSLLVLAPWALLDIIFYPTGGGVILDWNEGLRELALTIPATADEAIYWKRSICNPQQNTISTGERGATHDESTLSSLVLWLQEK